MTDITADAGGVEGVEGSAPLEPGGPLGPAGSTVAVAVRTTAVPRAAWRLLLRRPTFIVGAIIIVFWVVCALFGHAIAPYNPLAQQLLFNNNGPSAAHWFGTDSLGRDVLSRVIVGARDILVVTPLATILGTILGTALGLAMGYLGGTFDVITGRIVEAVLALPAVIIAFLFIAALGPSTVTLIVVIGLIFTPLIARTVRAAVLTERNLDYLSSARLLGERPLRIMFREILPNVMPAILVEFTVRLGYACSPWPRCPSSASASSRPHLTGGRTSRPTTAACWRATGGRCCSRRSPSPPW
jgi:peptide/nickel transport system permease protein